MKTDKTELEIIFFTGDYMEEYGLVKGLFQLGEINRVEQYFLKQDKTECTLIRFPDGEIRYVNLPYEEFKILMEKENTKNNPTE